MRRPRGWLLGSLALLLAAAVAPPVLASPPVVTAIEISSPHRLPEERIRAVIGDLVGRPRLRGALRERLKRLWALGLFSSLRVDEVADPPGVRLTLYVERRPHVRRVDFRGDLGLPAPDLAAAAGLAVGGSAEPEPLAEARQALLALYRREGFFGARVDVETVADPATNARDVAFVVSAGEPARVGKVEIAGLVESALGLRPGDRYREKALDEGVAAARQRLRDEGFAEARVTPAAPAWDPATNRVTLALRVEEGPRLRVEFAGRRALDAPLLQERLTFAHVGAVDDVEVQASARQIAALYRARGYHFVDVKGALVREEADARVEFTIREGPRVLVESVEFPGAPLPPARLSEQIETRPPGPFSPGAFVQETVERDARALGAYLGGHGFPEARVGPPRVHFSDDRTRARVVIPVEPGPRVTVGRVTVAGQAVFSAADLLAALPFGPGAPWSPAAAEEGRRRLERRYARRGYHAVDVRVEHRRRDGQVDVTYRIGEGTPTRIGRILVRGLTFTRLDVVTRELPFGPGDPYDPEALVEAQRRLGQLGVFEQAEVGPLRPAPAPFADVLVTVREARPWHVAAGVGFTTFEGARAFGELGHDNLFGTGRSLALRQRLSERGDRTDLLYREPWLLGTRAVGDAALFRERREEIGFELERFGVALGAQRDLWPETIGGLRGALRYQLSVVDRFNVDRTLGAVDVDPGREIVATLTPELILDRRDQPFDPRSGSFHLAALEVGGLALGGDADFVKSRLETSWFLDWAPPTVLALSGRLGLGAALRDTPALPIEERFFAGGATTVRGYRERGLGPRDAKGNPAGGDAQVVVNAEWRFPLWRWFGGALFVDTGAITPEVDDLGPGDLKSGVGGGVRLRTPVGPIRVDLGYPLSDISGEAQKARLYFTVGHPF